MAIHWNLQDCKDLPRNEKGGTAIPAVTDILIFGSVYCGIPSVTEKNWKEFYRRLVAYDIASNIDGNLVATGYQGNERAGVRPSHVKLHIGLKTNAAPYSKVEFKKRLVNMILTDVKRREERDNEADLEIANEKSDFVAAKIKLEGKPIVTGWFLKSEAPEGGIRYSPRGFGAVPNGLPIIITNNEAILKEVNVMPTLSGFLPYVHLDLEPGDTVTIYEDPITCEKKEGRAKLIREIGDRRYGDYLERWLVRFKGAGEQSVEREINLGNC